MQQGQNIFITGTNRGLGKELVKLLHKDHPQLTIHISSRSTSQDLSQQWRKDFPDHHFDTYQIDLNNSHSIANSVELIKKKGIKFDAIVANAAVGCDFGEKIPSAEIARSTLQTNVIATIDFVKQFLPLLSPSGRVIIVSAALGSLDVHSKEIKEKLTNPQITEEEIVHIAKDYINSAVKKDMGNYHWSAYRTSKALINAWTRFILVKYLSEGQTQICLHPGWCDTDMGGKNAQLTAEEGAHRINQGIWLQKVDHAKFYNKRFCDYETCY